MSRLFVLAPVFVAFVSVSGISTPDSQDITTSINIETSQDFDLPMDVLVNSNTPADSPQIILARCNPAISLC